MKFAHSLLLSSVLGTSSAESKLGSSATLPASSSLPQPKDANINIPKTANSKLRSRVAQVGKAVRSKVGKTRAPSEGSVGNESASFQSQEIDYHGQAADDLSEITSPSLNPPISANVGPVRNINAAAPGVWIPGGQEDSRNRLANTLRYELTKPDGHLSDPLDDRGAGSLNTSPSVSNEDSAPAAWNAGNIKYNLGRTANTVRHRLTSKPGEHLSDPLIQPEDEQRDFSISSSSSSIVSSTGWSTGTSNSDTSSQLRDANSLSSVSLISNLPSGHSSKSDEALESSGEPSIPTGLPTNTINDIDPPSRLSRYKKFTPKLGQRAPNTATTIFPYPPMVTDIIAGQEVKFTGFFEPAHRLQRSAKAAGQAIQAKLKPANPGAISAQSVTTSIAQPSMQTTGVTGRGMRVAKSIQNRFKSSSAQETK